MNTRGLSGRSAYSGHPHAVPAETPGIRPWIFYATFAGLLLTNVVTLVTLLMSSDIAGLISSRNEQLHVVYQDRIVQLRQEVDRLYSRQYAQAGNINLQLQELVAQQDMLTEQHQYVKALAGRAQELGLDTAALPDLNSADDTLITGAISDKGADGISGIEDITRSIGQMMTESRLALAALSETAEESTDTIVEELNRIGIKPRLPDLAATGVGGPYMPAVGEPESGSLVDDANAVAAAFERFRMARGVAAEAPIQQPLKVNARISSRYGNRKDPFLKRNAFHSGMDFAAPSGTTVHSAGPGKVIFAGRKSGYGKVVEVEHANGFVTRYAHLSAWLVTAGEIVDAGTPIAKVGSTGRSTGPHLHFEVRRADTPIDPSGFLKAGSKLAAFL